MLEIGYRRSFVALVSGALLLGGCDSSGPVPGPAVSRVVDPETARMIERLATLVRDAEKSNPFEFTKQIQAAEKMLSDPLEPMARLKVLSDLAFMKNTAGDPRGALD